MVRPAFVVPEHCRGSVRGSWLRSTAVGGANAAKRTDRLLSLDPAGASGDRRSGMERCGGDGGGVPLEEINFRTMESKLVSGLYLIGEILIVTAASAASIFNGPASGHYCAAATSVS